MRSLSGGFRLLAVLMAACLVACGGSKAAREDVSDRHEGSGGLSALEDAPAAAVFDASRPRVVVLGDSLTAGLGLPLKEAYPTLLQERINDDGLKYTVVNAGVSGDTSAGGLSRLDWALDGEVKVLIVALGGNDGLRGLPAVELSRNLATIIERAQSRKIAVILAGMEAPPNYGVDYTLAFHKVYPALAKKYDVALVPFLLQGVGGIADLNQNDGIHPTARGARIVADNVWTVLKPALEADSRRVTEGKAPGR